MALRVTLFIVGLLCAASLVSAQFNFRVLDLSGRLADPVNVLTGFGATNPDVDSQQGPDAFVFYLPSARSAGLTPAIDAGTQTLILNIAAPGPGTLPAPAAADVRLGLANAGGSCSLGAALSGVAAPFAVVTPTARNVVGDTIQYTFTVPTGTAGNSWNQLALEIETSLLGQGRKLCVGVVVPTPEGIVWDWTGLFIRVAWNCDVAGGDAAQQCSNLALTAPEFQVLSGVQFLALSGATRSVCCKSTIGLNVGVCTNPRAQTCCGGNPRNPGEKCCSSTTEVVTFDSAPCPCRASSQFQNTTTLRTSNSDCREPTGAATTNLFAADQCCLPSVARFPELRDPTTGGIRAANGFSGFCYSPNGPTKCCETGELYDPGSSQCCIINGVQDVATPCPCQNDAQCVGGQTDVHTSSQRCCRGTFPDVPIARTAEVCSAYANFPFAASQGQPALPGTTTGAAAALQRCFGQCIDTNFQICCNGVACARNFERCCNTTCCNRFTATCRYGIAQAPAGNALNGANFRETTVRCSSVYFLHGLRSFFIFALPGFLLLATLLGLAVVLVFANKASNRSYSFIESGMILFAIIVILFALPLYFSPGFKYAVVVVLVGLTTILSAAARVRSLNVLAIVGIVVALLYVFDPFTGNQYLNFVSFRVLSTGFVGRSAAGAINPLVQVPGQPDYKTNGLLHMITAMWRENQDFCVNFYDYFRLDGQLLDWNRFDNPAETTYGYCRRGWVFALLIFEIIMMSALIILFIISLLALLLRFRKAADLAPVELEVKMI